MSGTYFQPSNKGLPEDVTALAARTTARAILAYGICGGFYSVLQQQLMLRFPYPCLLEFARRLFTLNVIMAGETFGMILVDPVNIKFLVPYLLYAVLFSLGAYCAPKLDAETIVACRALSPCVVAVLDAAVLGRAEYPTRRGWTALLLIAASGMCYLYHSVDDVPFEKPMAVSVPSSVLMTITTTTIGHTSSWPFAAALLYLIAVSLEAVCGAWIMHVVHFQTTSGPVLYADLAVLGPMAILAVHGQEIGHIVLNDIPRPNEESLRLTTGPGVGMLLLVLMLLLGVCIVGTATSYTGWRCRGQVSATSFSVIDAVIACLVGGALSAQASGTRVITRTTAALLTSLLCLLLCLTGAALYQEEAPLTLRRYHHHYDIFLSRPASSSSKPPAVDAPGRWVGGSEEEAAIDDDDKDVEEQDHGRPVPSRRLELTVKQGASP